MALEQSLRKHAQERPTLFSGNANPNIELAMWQDGFSAGTSASDRSAAIDRHIAGSWRYGRTHRWTIW
jgi:hypothetical protein